MKRYSSLWLVVLLAVLGCEPALPPLADGPDMDSQQAEIELVTQTRQLEPISVQLGSAELLAGIPGDGPLTTEELEAWLAAPSQHAPLDFTFPMWLTPGAGQAKDLSEEPLTRAKIELGRQLFFDPRLSADKTISCASCHEPEKGYSVSTPFASGVGGQVGKRNPPTLLNRVMLALGDDRQFWDGRSASVEEALLHALHDPTEMAADPQETVAKLKGIDGYQLQFERIYGEVSWDAIGDAVGGGIRCLVTGSSPYDYQRRWEVYQQVDPEYLADDPELASRYEAAKAAAEAHPMSEHAKRGEYLFFGNKASCSACHSGVNFTDELYRNIGIGLGDDEPDLGRYHITHKDEDWGAFKTPSIRTAVWTAPYMHDGSLATLENVVEWYAQGGRPNRNLDYHFKKIEGQELTDQDKHDLVEFIKACSGLLPQVETGRLPE